MGMKLIRAIKSKLARPSLTRSEIMARVRSQDTGPELIVRHALHAAGLRYRLHRRNLPGTPDIVLPSRRAVVLVHGCFWHSHPGCARARVPMARRSYWEPKLARTVERDRIANIELAALGWKVFIVWECELKRTDLLTKLVGDLKATKLYRRKAEAKGLHGMSL